MVKNSAQVGKSYITSILMLAGIGYAVWTVGTSVNRNVATNKRIAQLEAEIAALKTENSELENLTYYYQTDSFKEIEARRRLGLKAKDEQVVILPKQTINPATDENNVQDERKLEKEEDESNITKWWGYLFNQK